MYDKIMEITTDGGYSVKKLWNTTAVRILLAIVLVMSLLEVNVTKASAATDEPKVLAKAAIIVDADSGKILYEKNTLNKQTITINLKDVSNVNVSRNIFEAITGTRKVKLDVNSTAATVIRPKIKKIPCTISSIVFTLFFMYFTPNRNKRRGIIHSPRRLPSLISRYYTC